MQLYMDVKLELDCFEASITLYAGKRLLLRLSQTTVASTWNDTQCIAKNGDDFRISHLRKT